MAISSKKLKLTSSKGVSQDISLYSTRTELPADKKVIAVENNNTTLYASIGGGENSILVSNFGNISKEFNSDIVSFIFDGKTLDPYIQLPSRSFIDPSTENPDIKFSKYIYGLYNGRKEEYKLVGVATYNDIQKGIYIFKTDADINDVSLSFKEEDVTFIYTGMESNYRMHKMTVKGKGKILLTLNSLKNSKIEISYSRFVPSGSGQNINSYMNFTSPAVILPSSSLGFTKNTFKMIVSFQGYGTYTSNFNFTYEILNGQTNSVMHSLSGTIDVNNFSGNNFYKNVNINPGTSIKVRWSISGLEAFKHNVFPINFNLQSVL